MIPLRRHDRYVLKAYWAAFGAVLVFFTLVVTIVHLAERMGRLLRHWEDLEEMGYDPAGVVTEYYATLVPFTWLQIVPLVAVLAATLALSRLTRHNELAPLVTAGVSTRRLTLPILLSGLVLGGAVFATQETVVPGLSRRNQALARLIRRRELDRIHKVPHFQDPGPRRVRLSMAAFRPVSEVVEGALVTLRTDDGTLAEMRWYPELAWDAEAGAWIATQGGTLFPLAEDPTGTRRPPIPVGARAPLTTDLNLLEVSVSRDAALGLSARETAALVRADPENPRLVMLHHEQFTRPLAPFVLLLLSLPFCLRLGRRRVLPGVAAVLATGGVYYGTAFLFRSLSTAGDVNPVVLAWTPTVLLGSLGLALWLGMES